MMIKLRDFMANFSFDHFYLREKTKLRSMCLIRHSLKLVHYLLSFTSKMLDFSQDSHSVGVSHGNNYIIVLLS